ncbi:MAG: class I SAM-dependent methyltransferase [Desulfobacteraceae bacterium]|nr:class I SAM-dependent methyltransferase [Desulfobacteraceae bacterium]
MELHVKAHYNSNNLQGKIADALEKAGKDTDRLILKELAPIDQLHTGGASATLELFNKARLQTGSEVLDAGCGIGGSSRLLAKEYGHIVTGIDLADQFVSTAKFLTNGTRLSDQVHFYQGSITDMSFEKESFDAILCQHILVNIQNKQKVFKEFCRVLKPNGKLILHEIVKGNNEQILFPVPWADKEEISFLDSWDNMESGISNAGFSRRLVSDQTQDSAAWWAKVKEFAKKKDNARQILGPHLVFGENAAAFGKTMSYNFKWKRIKVFEAIFEKE